MITSSKPLITTKKWQLVWFIEYEYTNPKKLITKTHKRGFRIFKFNR